MVGTVLVLGANVFALPVLRQLSDAGYRVLVGDGNESAAALNEGYAGLVLDITNPLEVLRVAQENQVSAIMPLNDFSMRAACWSNQVLGLRGPSLSQAIFATSKSAMRRVAREWGVCQPHHYFGDSKSDLKTLASNLQYPMVVKPSFSGGGGRGISVINSPGQLETALDSAFEKTLDTEVIIEEFVDGVEVTADLLVFDGHIQAILVGQKVRHETSLHVASEIAFEPFTENVDSPKILRTLNKLVEVSSLRNGMMHVELILNEALDEAVFVELGLRGGGGHIFSGIFEQVTGISGPVGCANVLSGSSVMPPNGKHGAAIYRFLNPSHPGFIRRLEAPNLELPAGSSLEYGLLNESGVEFKGLTSSLDRVAYLVTKAPTLIEATELANNFENGLQFVYSS